MKRLYVVGMLVAVGIALTGCDFGTMLATEGEGGESSSTGASEPILESLVFKVSDNPELTEDIEADVSSGYIYVQVPAYFVEQGVSLFPRMEMKNVEQVSPNGAIALDDPDIVRLKSPDGVFASYGITVGVVTGSVTTLQVSDPFWIDNGTKRTIHGTVEKEGDEIRVLLPPENYSLAEVSEIQSNPIGFDRVEVPVGASVDADPIKAGISMPAEVSVVAQDGTEVSYLLSTGRPTAGFTELKTARMLVAEVQDYTDRWEFTNGRSDAYASAVKTFSKSLRDNSRYGGSTHHLRWGGFAWSELFSDYSSSVAFRDEQLGYIRSRHYSSSDGSYSKSYTLFGESYVDGGDSYSHPSGDSGVLVENEYWVSSGGGFSIVNDAAYEDWDDRIVDESTNSMTHEVKVRWLYTRDNDDEWSSEKYRRAVSFPIRLRRQFSARDHFQIRKVYLELAQNGAFENVRISDPAMSFDLGDDGSSLTIMVSPRTSNWSGELATFETVSEDGLSRTARTLQVVE